MGGFILAVLYLPLMCLFIYGFHMGPVAAAVVAFFAGPVLTGALLKTLGSCIAAFRDGWAGR